MDNLTDMNTTPLMTDYHITAPEAQEYLLQNPDKSLYTTIRPYRDINFTTEVELDIMDLMDCVSLEEELNIIVQFDGNLLLVND